MKKLMIEENRDRALNLISEIERVYITRVETLIVRIRALGIQDISKEMVVECINRNFKNVSEQHRELYRKDLEVFDSPEMRSRVAAPFIAKFKEVEKAAEDFYNKEVTDRLPYNLQVLAAIFELNDKSAPYIPEEKKEVIIEGFKVYLQNPDLLKIYLLHEETAKKLQELVTSIRKNGIDSLNSMLSVGGFAILSLFEIGDNVETGSFLIKPRRIKYEADPVVVDALD